VTDGESELIEGGDCLYAISVALCVDVCTGIFYLLRFSVVFSSLFDRSLSISAFWVRS